MHDKQLTEVFNVIHITLSKKKIFLEYFYFMF